MHPTDQTVITTLLFYLSSFSFVFLFFCYSTHSSLLPFNFPCMLFSPSQLSLSLFILFCNSNHQQSNITRAQKKFRIFTPPAHRISPSYLLLNIIFILYTFVISFSSHDATICFFPNDFPTFLSGAFYNVLLWYWQPTCKQSRNYKKTLYIHNIIFFVKVKFSNVNITTYVHVYTLVHKIHHSTFSLFFPSVCNNSFYYFQALLRHLKPLFHKKPHN